MVRSAAVLLCIAALLAPCNALGSPAHFSPGLSTGGDRAVPVYAEKAPLAFLSADAGEHILESTKDFLMGAVSGGLASFSVFPIDMAKTRIQDQKVVEGGQVLYKNAIQTIAKVFREEGIASCYNGIIPVIVGSAPEAALQLGGNNAARAWFSEQMDIKVKDLPLWAEIVSGSAGGFAQVLATQPMERVKILQQVLGAQAGGVVNIVKTLGVGGLYQGWKACFLRDIPFSAIYFPFYQRTKKALLELRAKREGKKVDHIEEGNLMESLIAGLVAGVPGAGLTCPCDVIKTRMQSCGTGGKLCDVSAFGIRETTMALFSEGGIRAFFKGVVPRVGRVGPQLAICLVIFEGLKQIFPPKAKEAVVTKAGSKPEPKLAKPVAKSNNKNSKPASAGPLESMMDLFKPKSTGKKAAAKGKK